MPFEPGEDPLLAMVVMIFGFDTKGQLLALGKNEFLSAIVAIRCLMNVLETKYLFQARSLFYLIVITRESEFFIVIIVLSTLTHFLNNSYTHLRCPTDCSLH